MKPFKRSIIELFDGKKRYVVPLYQRQYAWPVKPQIEALWTDIKRISDKLMAGEEVKAPHFLGAAVIAQIKTFGRQVSTWEVIDGQQRLTTFQLFLAALRDVAQKNDSAYTTEIDKYLFNTGVMENVKIERYKLWPSYMDRESFVNIVDPHIDISELGIQSAKLDGYVRRSVLVYEYLKVELNTYLSLKSETPEFVIEKIFEALKSGLAIVSIELEENDDPQVIFETLNSRGVDLKASDLMRNFIFQRASGRETTNLELHTDRLYEKYWLELDSGYWGQKAPRGRNTEERVDWLFVDHLSMKTAQNISIRKLYNEYKRWIIDETPFENIESELVSLKTSSAVVEKLFSKNTKDPVGEFGVFADAFDVSTVMPLVVYLASEGGLEESDLIDSLNALKSFILRRDICGLTTKNYNNIFVDFIKKMRAMGCGSAGIFREILSIGNADGNRWPDDEEFKEGFLNRDQYKSARSKRLNYLLKHIEITMRTTLSEDIEIKSALSIEHIMPQKWQQHWPITGFEHDDPDEPSLEKIELENKRSSHIHKIGNLTLLTQPLNSKLKNASYSVRMPEVKAHSSLALNRELQVFDSWDEAEIQQRSMVLYERAKKIWVAPPIREQVEEKANPEKTLEATKKRKIENRKSSEIKKAKSFVLKFLEEDAYFEHQVELLEAALLAIEHHKPGTFEILKDYTPRTKYIIAKDPYKLFQGRPDLAENCTREILSGWWMGTNNSWDETSRWIERACEFAGISFGNELIISKDM